MVRLEALAPEHLPGLLALHLPADQLAFTSHPSEVLPRVEGDPDRRAVVITAGEQAVGLFVLSVGAHRDRYLPVPDPSGVALSSLSVDARTQGRGVGTAAMRLLPMYVPQVFSGADHVLLVVNQRNAPARRVYERVGFTVTGERQGPIGPQWLMALALPGVAVS
ncbi:GNAT family N-acetyltransferase [Deinococcus petrolearius]|uniref:GNAT family N-acetyltransferase n=1 Tax=Deinococcus petrolearius TaxID=1751295 RepID=A0ABW1DGS8_9DEIO